MMRRLTLLVLVAILLVPLLLVPSTPRVVAATGGTLIGWGGNYKGTLCNGIGTDYEYDPYMTPQLALGAGSADVIATVSGKDFTLLLRADGTLYSCGRNELGQLGLGTAGYEPVAYPRRVIGLAGVTAIAAGAEHALALTGDGRVWSWGYSVSGQLGRDTPSYNVIYATPQPVPGLADIAAIAAGPNNSFAVTRGGTAWAWGDNNHGNNLGVENYYGRYATSRPEQVMAAPGVPLASVAAIAPQFDQTIVLKTDGTVWTWGTPYSNLAEREQLPSGLFPARYTALGGDVAAIAAGHQHGMALKRDGSVWTWGGNWSGERGDGTVAGFQGGRGLPARVTLPGAAVAISAGDSFSLALLANGTLASWGQNTNAQLGQGTTISSGPLTGNPNPGLVTGLTAATGLMVSSPGALRGALALRATPASPFGDVPPGVPAAEAVGQLNGRGVINGCDPTVAPPLFCPTDPTLRAQMAALIVRAMGWGDENPRNPFPDRNGVDDELWRSVAILAQREVARGYQDGTYGTTSPVLNAQVISFVTRAMVKRGYWQFQADNGAIYPNVPAASGHRQDLATYVHYAGAVRGTASATSSYDGWDGVSSRAYFAFALWQALQSAAATP